MSASTRKSRFVAAGLAGCLAAAALAVSAGFAVPAAGQPGDSVPDSGSRPTAAGPVTLPGSGGTVQTNPVQQTPGLGPLATQIMTESRTVESLGEQLKQAEEVAERATAATQQAERRWRESERHRDSLRQRADSAAADAYKRGTELGPFDEHAQTLHQLSQISPALGPLPGGEALPRALLQAETDCGALERSYRQLTGTASTATTRRDQLRTSFTQRQAALNDLKTRNAAFLRQAEAERDAFEQSLADGKLGEINADGKAANPQALSAVRYALGQLNKPYLWGATGPDRYDCSGLVWAAYRSVQYSLPRVANEQYRGTAAIKSSRSVKGDLLVPGDLLFFSTDRSDWTQIHHVAMYIGSGRMVHAPNQNDVVRIAPIWWSEFFGATRVFKEVPAPAPKAPAPSASSSKRTESSSPADSSPSPSASSSSPSPSPAPSPTPASPSAAAPSATATQSDRSPKAAGTPRPTG